MSEYNEKAAILSKILLSGAFDSIQSDGRLNKDLQPQIDRVWQGITDLAMHNEAIGDLGMILVLQAKLNVMLTSTPELYELVEMLYGNEELIYNISKQERELFPETL